MGQQDLAQNFNFRALAFQIRLIVYSFF